MYETKVILMSLASQIALAKTAKQAYEMVRIAAQVEGLTIPDIEKMQEKIIGDVKQSEE